jgi:hypothetical protein
MRYELTNCEWFAIRPMLPNKPRGVPRVNDRRVLTGKRDLLLAASSSTTLCLLVSNSRVSDVAGDAPGFVAASGFSPVRLTPKPVPAVRREAR